MSKQDTHFINVFSLVIGLLVAVAIAIFFFARIHAGAIQAATMRSDAEYVKSVAARVEPPARVAVAGQDNAGLEIKPDPGAQQTAAAGSAAGPKNGDELFQQVCTACHGAGIGGAPKAGDKSAWGPRIAQGKSTLYQHALAGYQGKAGYMPPKGGRPDLSDDLVKQGVDYMVGLAQK